MTTTLTSVNRKHPLAKCEACPLLYAKCAPTSGPEGARVAIVSRSPGWHDGIEGRPFAGPSGKVLDHLLEQNGLARKDVLVTNVVLCQTDKPPKEAIEACKDRLETEINAAEIIVACGPEAGKSLVGATSVHSARGFVHRRENISGRQQGVVVTTNPALVLRQAEAYPDLVRDFRRAFNPIPTPTYPEVRYVDRLGEAEKWARRINEDIKPGDRISADIESRGLSFNAPLVCVGLSKDGTRAVVFGESVVNDESFNRRYLKKLLERRDVNYVWHGGKFDTKVLKSHGIDVEVNDDTLLLSYVLDERPGTHSLEYLLMEHLAWGNYEPASVKKFKSQVMNAEKANRNVMGIYYDPEELYTYNGWDTAGTAQLFDLLYPQLDEDDIKHYEFLLAANEALKQVELNGIGYDIETAAELLEMEIRHSLVALRENVRAILKSEAYNPNSAVQNARLVYDQWQITLENRAIASRPEKQRSVDKPVYLEIASGRFRANTNAKTRTEILNWAKGLRDYKELDKLRSTYVEGLIGRVVNGRIHASFKIHGTTSGRLSSEGPNLQNIPRPKSGQPNIRALFRASIGHTIVQADYSQAELRVIAHLSQDPKLLEIYRKGDDLHSIVAERFYGSSFTKAQRDRAKNMDFGVAYGQGPETFQEKHEIPKEEAAEFIKWWWAEFSHVKEWRDVVHRRALHENILITPFGRKRRIHLITKENRNEILRESVNFYPQSIASDFTLWSFINSGLYDYVVNLVHDSIVLDCPDPLLGNMDKVIKSIMEQAPIASLGWTDVPFEVEVLTGPSWGEVG